MLLHNSSNRFVWRTSCRKGNALADKVILKFFKQFSRSHGCLINSFSCHFLSKEIVTSLVYLCRQYFHSWKLCLQLANYSLLLWLNYICLFSLAIRQIQKVSPSPHPPPCFHMPSLYLSLYFHKIAFDYTQVWRILTVDGKERQRYTLCRSGKVKICNTLDLCPYTLLSLCFEISSEIISGPSWNPSKVARLDLTLL